MKIFSIEGNSQKLDGGAMFGNAPKVLWQNWFFPDSLNRITLATRALLIQTNSGKNILFETGIGVFFEPKLKERYGVFQNEHILLENLKTIGLTDSDIDIVVLSHLHFDHAGGLLSKYEEGLPRLLFPHAKFLVSKKNWERASFPPLREKGSFIPIIQDLLLKSGRLDLVNENDSFNIGIPLQFHFSDGHTLGLMISEINLPDGPIFFVSDLVPGLPWIHLPITMGYDRFPEKIVEEKRIFFNYVIEKKGYLFFTHDPDIVCAKIEKDEKGNYFGIETTSLLEIIR